MGNLVSSIILGMVVVLSPLDGGNGYSAPPVEETYAEETEEAGEVWTPSSNGVTENEEEEAEEVYYTGWTGPKLAPGIGTVYGPTGKETYYDMPMWTLISWARDAGYSEEEYPYWVREDGCKMLGKFIMCAANLDHFPRYSLVESSLGTCIVVDTGDFIYYDEGWNWLDIATDWTNPNGE